MVLQVELADRAEHAYPEPLRQAPVLVEDVLAGQLNYELVPHEVLLAHRAVLAGLGHLQPL